jgi:RNA polymerase sigma-70 factor (ECF subfamily)
MFGTVRTSDFNSVVKQYYPAIVFFAEKIIDNHAVAEEIAQDVFVKLWEQEQNFDNDNNIRNFLYLSARNRCLNYIRDTKRKQQREEAIPLSAISEDEITNNIILAEVWREIAIAIDTLPEQCRKVIQLSFQEGKTTNEIASLLEITESTVRNQKARGLSLLKKSLSNKAFSFLLLLL